MTDKKFSLLSFEYGLFEDNETGNGFDMEKCVELLNSMYEKNEQLKQTSQDYEDNVCNWFIDNWNKLSDEMKQSAHLELGIDIEYDGDDGI